MFPTLIVALALLGLAAVLLRRTTLALSASERQVAELLTLREAQQLELERLVAGLGAANEGLVVVDQQGHVVAANAVARAFADPDGATVDAPLAGLRLEELMPWQQLHEALRRSRRTGENESFEIVEPEPSGRTLAVRVNVLRDRGTVIGILDQSRIRRLESLRRDFVANVSHELKTPLAAIQGFVETMQDDPEMPPDIRGRYLERVARQTHRLGTLVSDLLTLSRLDDEAGMANVEPCDFGAVLRETVRDLLPIAETREVLLRSELPEEPLWVHADREALRQLAGNLVDNALKYTAERGTVTVRLQARGARLRLDVTDTGIGLSQADQERVFERFFRVDRARSRDLGGTGLGLSIVKNTARNLGGDVGVHSELGVGSRFWVELPAEQPAG